MSRTTLFLFGYFLPSWLSALLMWGDDRTSALFAPAPGWFVYVRLAIQISAILVLFMPLRMRPRPLAGGALLAATLILSLAFLHPSLEAEFILVSSSAQVGMLAIFLCLAQPAARLESSDIKFLYYMILFGFILQFVLYFAFNRLPSHSIEDVFLRFNGITNDSLSIALILPLLIPWAVQGENGKLKLLVVLGESMASGSLFAVVFTILATFCYLIYKKMYKFVAIVILLIISLTIYLYDLLSLFLEIKLLSILTHLRFFLDLGGVQIEQPSTSCSEEFCESFIEAGGHLNPLYLILFLGLLLYFIFPLFREKLLHADRSVVHDSLRIYGGTLIAASFVHPIPLIPFAVPMFLIFSGLHSRDRRRLRLHAHAPVRNPG